MDNSQIAKILRDKVLVIGLAFAISFPIGSQPIYNFQQQSQPAKVEQKKPQTPTPQSKVQTKEQKEIDELVARLARDQNKARRDLAAAIKRGDYTVLRSEHFVLLYRKPKSEKGKKEKEQFGKEMLALMEVEFEKCMIDFKCPRPTTRVAAIILDTEKDYQAAVGLPETTAAFSTRVEVILFKRGIISDNELNHETFHAVIEMEKKRIRGGKSFIHMPIEEGLAHSRENEQARGEQIQESSALSQLGAGYSTEFILINILPPEGITRQEESDLRVQASSLVQFLLDKGVSHRDILILAKDIFEAYERNGFDEGKSLKERKGIVKKFLENHKINPQSADKQWRDWERKQIRPGQARKKTRR